jgi:hypothetical protein
MADRARSDGRTHYEAVLDVRYGMRYNDLCERFYNRLDFWISVLTVAGGSAAVLSAVIKDPEVAAYSGAVLAVIGIIGRQLGASRKAEQHGQAKKAYAALDAKSHALTVEQLDAELKPLQASAPSGIRLLALPAYNANLRTNGRPDLVQELSLGERLAFAFA